MAEKMYQVEILGETKTYPENTSYEEIVAPYQEQYEGMISLVSANGRIRELFKTLHGDCKLELFTLKDAVGHKTYERAATMILFKSIFDVFGTDAAATAKLEFTVGNGYYVNTKGVVAATKENADKIKAKMQEHVDKKTPFQKRTYAMEDAVDIFQKQHMEDKLKLFSFRRSSAVNVYEMEGYFDYNYGYMTPNAGYVKYFDLIPYEEGFMLLLPNRKTPNKVDPFVEKKKLFNALKTTTDWGIKVGIETVGDLNEKICQGSLSDLILVQEAEQERRIAEIAKEIAQKEDIKFVMIAGPSSSGKTSFSHRLSIQLRTLGKTPHPIALDDYFVDREFTPLDEDGNYNFECLEALDTKRFNEDMIKLLKGERVELPTFNFKIGKREYRGNYKQLGPDDILVIEGIHGLNAKMSYALPEESKYKIYISSLTTINVDGHNRIPTTDGRLLRRMVRDARTRGADARRTIGMWPSVRRGEEENIFPFQEQADVMFNSASVIELAALKQYAEPLLFQIPKDAPEYHEARRLLKFLDYFLNVTSEFLPNNSISREFVGGSCFNV